MLPSSLIIVSVRVKLRAGYDVYRLISVPLVDRGRSQNKSWPLYGRICRSTRTTHGAGEPDGVGIAHTDSGMYRW